MNKDVQTKFDDYPDSVKVRMIELRRFILSLIEREELGPVEETLKWGEPSYLVETGSSVRIDWKMKTPNHFYVYFHCQTQLIETFRELHSDRLTFQGNRAIVLDIEQPLPTAELEQSLLMAFQYKKLKHLPLLGA